MKRITILMIISILVIAILGGTAYANTNHWAKPYAEKLIELYPEAADIINSIQLDKTITSEDFKSFIDFVSPSDEVLQIDNVTREVVINELVKYWSKITGIHLGEVVVPMVMIFEDEMDIDYDYRSNIMIAYFKGLVKGKGNNLFAPKDNITYGEAITLLTRFIDLINEENQGVIDEGPKGDIMKGFETKAEVDVKEEEVVFDFQLVNNSEEKRELHFSSGQQFEIVITNEAGEEVYRYSDDRFFTMALLLKEIQPGEAMTWSDVWDKSDKDGNIVEAGNYTAVISIVVMNTDEVDIEEFSATIEFDI